MVQNFTSTNTSVLSGVERFQCAGPLDIFTVIVNVISFLINSLHLCIISQLEALKGTQYRFVLMNIALADIVIGIVSVMFFSCYDFFIFNYAAGEPELRIPLMIVIIFLNYISFHVFLVASIEKYVAICKPFSYQSSMIVTRLPVVFAIVWLYIFTSGTVTTVIEVLDLIPWLDDLGMAAFRTTIFAIIPNLLSAILLIKVYGELKRMRSRSQNSAEDNDKRKAAMYLIIIFTLEMIVFLLNSVCMIIFYTTKVVLGFKLWHGFIKTPYTILNTVIYGWRTQSYRQRVRKVTGCPQRQVGNVEG